MTNNLKPRGPQIELTLQILVGLATVMLLGLGTMSMFAPRRMVKNFAIEPIEPIGTAGLSIIRSVIGGLFIASVAMLTFGLVTDGFDKAVVPPLVVELVIIAVLLRDGRKRGELTDETCS